MNKFKHIWLTIVQLFKNVCLIPETIAQTFAQKKQRAVRNENEIERLDRIRNPSKYLGK